MSEKIDDGGNAFPFEGGSNNGYYPDPGMTLRDWFAGQAMAGMLAHSTRYRPRDGAPKNWHDAISEEAYEIATAMIQARKAKT